MSIYMIIFLTAALKEIANFVLNLGVRKFWKGPVMNVIIKTSSYLIALRTVPTNSKVFWRGLLNMREKQILTSDIEIQKENWGNQAFFDAN